jgi:hypothetical protein
MILFITTAVKTSNPTKIAVFKKGGILERKMEIGKRGNK